MSDSKEIANSKQTRWLVWTRRMAILVFCATAIGLFVWYLQLRRVTAAEQQVLRQAEQRLDELEVVRSAIAEAQEEVDRLDAIDTKRRELIRTICSKAKGVKDFPVTQGDLFVVSGAGSMANGGWTLYVPPGEHFLRFKFGIQKSIEKSNDMEYVGEPFEERIRLPSGAVCQWRYKVKDSEGVMKVDARLIDQSENVIYQMPELEYEGKLAGGGMSSHFPQRIFAPNQYAAREVPLVHLLVFRKVVPQATSQIHLSEADKQNGREYFAVSYQLESPNHEFVLPDRYYGLLPQRKREMKYDVIKEIEKANRERRAQGD